MHRHRIIPVALLFGLAPAVAAHAQDPAEEAQERLDYLVGSWDAVTEFYDADGNVIRTDRSVHVIEPFLGDKVLVTTSVDSDGTIRRTLRFYDRADRRFYEIGVGEAGDVWILSGGMDAYVMTSQARPTADGGTVMVRFTHTNIRPNSFEAVMEVSRDRGATWTRANRRQRLERRTAPGR